MVSSTVSNDFAGVLEVAVVFFQVVGVVGLIAWRMLPGSRIAGHGRLAFVAAMFGLGIAGALLGCDDSEFALFAGGTMTALLIGMTLGTGSTDPVGPLTPAADPAPALAG